MRIAQVLIFRGVSQTFSYEAPVLFQVGHLVEVPFGRTVVKGLVMSILEETASIPLKAILALSPEKPLSASQVGLIVWMSAFYQISPYKAFQTVMGSHFQKTPVLPNPPQADIPFITPYPLSQDQEITLTSILQNPGKSFLIHGITASGKTEIYMQLAHALLTQNKQVLMLIPEIALTAQYAQQFVTRFGEAVSIVHSGLTPKQRSIEWHKINQGAVNIVIGPRSAIFAPLDRLGMVIIDEEHEPSYKQESSPRYFTHTVARYRCQQENASLILGSATPSVCSYAQYKQENAVFTLSKRVLNQPLPQVEVVDMKEEPEKGVILSRRFEEALTQCLAKKEKAMILINRRGYAPYVVCQHCATPYCCPHCQLSLTYHRDKNLRCHRCDFQTALTHICPKCKRPRLGFQGTGIQKVETELAQHFPQAKVYRLDRDTAKTAKQLDRILEDFKNEGDILLGTQLIAKGHHFEEVTLVGVLGIDTTLSIPDFSSPERAFQLLTQVAGRAGRGKKPGQVIIQSHQPQHYAIQHALSHHFLGFYEEEIAYRKQLLYPPFSELIHIIFSSKIEPMLKKTAQFYFKELSSKLSEYPDIRLMGPKPAPIEKLKDYFRWDIVLKCPPAQIQLCKEALLTMSDYPSSVRIMIDFEPRTVL